MLKLPSWLAAPDTPTETNINIIRALAVSSVFLHHAYAYLGVKTPIFGMAGGLIGVLLFFLISGYLIGKSAEKHALPDYVRHRFFRIYPAFITLFLVIGFAVGSLKISKIAEDPLGFLSYLVMLQHLFPEKLMRFSTLHVEWTLTIEVLWYVLAPAVVFLRRPWALVASVALIAVSFLWYYLARSGDLDPLYGGKAVMDAIHPAYQVLFIQSAFPAQIGFFIAGCLVCRYYRYLRLIPLLLLLCAVPFAFPEVPPFAHHGVNPLAPHGLAMAALLVLLLRLPALRSRLITWLSDISYSIYLLHAVVMVAIGLHYGWKGWGAFAVACAATLLLSSLSFILIEQPAMRYARHRDWRQARPTPLATAKAWITGTRQPVPFPAVNKPAVS